MSTPASKFTVGQVVIAAPDPATTTPCPMGITGIDAATCGAIASGEAADLTGKVFGPGAPAIPVARTKLPQSVQTLLNDCDGSSTCKLVSYDFDASTGERRDTLSHLISTVSTTAHNAGVFVKDGAGTAPLFRTIPGYDFDGMFSFDPDRHTQIPLPSGTNIIDERYCARACDDDATCGGFNYEQTGRKCTLFKKSESLTNEAYKDGRVAFIREDIRKTKSGSDPPGTNLTGSGAWCGLQNLTECNSDISNVITNNPEILSFTTSDLASCSACPAKTVSRTGATEWAVTNEIDTTTISSSSADTIAKLQYTTQSTPTPSTVLTPGSFYKIAPYLPGSSFQAQTFLYMKRIKKFEVFDSPGYRFWLMSGTYYSIPAGIYFKAEFLQALNAAGAPGTFSFDGSKFTWTGPYVTISLAGPLKLAGFVDGQEAAADQIDPVSGVATMTGLPVSFDDASGGFFTHGMYTQNIRQDDDGICRGLGNTGRSGFADPDKIPKIDNRKAILFGTLGTDFTNMSLDSSAFPSAKLEPQPVDYVANGFLLVNSATGKYLPASSWQRPSALTRAEMTPEQRKNSDGIMNCNSTPRNTSEDLDDADKGTEDSVAVFEWEAKDFYRGCSRESGKTLPPKYTPQYNGFIFIITPGTYSEFYNEATAKVPDQPLIIKRPGEPIPYIFNPGTEDFRVLRFPSQSSFGKHLAENPSWSKYYSPYRAIGTLRYMTLDEATDCGPPSVGGPGGTYAFEDYMYDPWPHMTVYDENFWNTVPYDDRVEIADPTSGCADPDNPSAYIGGEYKKTVGTVSYCELCPAGTYSPASDKFASSCTPCAQGTYCPTGAGAEQQCAAGYYCPTPAAQIECPAGSYCPVGTANHIPCIAGDYCPAKSAAKQDCPAGSYCPTPAEKIECPAGSYCTQRVTAHTLCVDTSVPPRLTAAGTPFAFYCPPGTRTLNECPAGYSCAGNSVATPCPPGNYCPTGSNAAITCPGDSTYVPLGLTNVVGISQLTQVQVLNQIFTQGSTCYNCPGTLKANDAKTGCICTGDLVWRSWTNECLPNCPAGQASNAAKTGCDNCGDNTYTPEPGLAKCIRCATNVDGAPAVHNANKTGCVCNGTITGGTYVWNSTWNRCKTVCNNNHVAYWSRCYPTTVRASPVTWTAPTAEPYYECPNGSQNRIGRWASTTNCTKGAYSSGVSKGCIGPGCLCNFSCPTNWNKSSSLSFTGTNCNNNRSCYRGTIISKYECPECWKTSYYETGKSTSVCPSGFSSTSGTSYCDIPPTWIKDETSLGLGTKYSARCVWAGETNPACGTCPNVPAGGYTGPVVDTTLFTTGSIRMKCTMNSAPATPDPWGADGATPRIDTATGNIMLPSLVSLTLSSIAPPAGNPNIPCVAGTYLASSAGIDSTTEVTLVPGQVLPGTCLPCPTDGWYCGAGYAAPYRCPAGAYCPTNSRFETCGPGTNCPAGSTQEGTCPPSYYCPSSGAEKIVCPAGKYCPGGNDTPLACNTGEYCPAGSSDHNACAAGFYCTTPSEIAPCPAGKYCPTGTSVPRICEAGHYCPAGSKIATPCALGNYCNAGSSAQTPCDAGYYCPDPATRTACPAGTYNGTSGQTSSSGCTTCPAGKTCPYDGASTLFANPRITPITCAPGYYCPAGSATFNACPEGWYCPTPSQQTQCPQGYVCPIGTITYGVPTPRVTVSSSGAESCRATCARGTGLPTQWNGAICVGTNTPGTTCETINNAPVSCNCQQALGFGWIV